MTWRLADDSASAPVARSYWVVPSHFLAGAYPGHNDATKHAAKLQALWNAGARSFVSLMERDEHNHTGKPFVDYESPLRSYARAANEAVYFSRFPIVDVNIPTPELMTQILDHVDAELNAGRPIYLHCWGGIGRTGTAVGCWLIRHGHAAPHDTLEVLARLHRQDHEAKHRKSPETPAQARFIEAWKPGA